MWVVAGKFQDGDLGDAYVSVSQVCRVASQGLTLGWNKWPAGL